jgi:acyl-CoA synthetase (AMP-forming)/AMP-acid ligase II
MIAGDRTWTYRELRDESARVCQALAAEGVGVQDRVAVLDKNGPEFFAVLFGAAMARAVTLAVNWRLAPREMEYILDHAQAKVLFVGEEFLGHLAQMKLPQVSRVVVIGTPGAGQVGYQEWQASMPATDPDLACDPNETCFQLYTSGTTGRPGSADAPQLLSAMESARRRGRSTGERTWWRCRCSTSRAAAGPTGLPTAINSWCAGGAGRDLGLIGGTA